MRVDPDELHACATRLDGCGTVWGEAAQALRTESGDGGAFGGDDLGVALRGMYVTVREPTLTYADECGFCVKETGAGLHRMAGVYAEAEQTNTDAGGAVQRVLDTLGTL